MSNSEKAGLTCSIIETLSKTNLLEHLGWLVMPGLLGKSTKNKAIALKKAEILSSKTSVDQVVFKDNTQHDFDDPYLAVRQKSNFVYHQAIGCFSSSRDE